MPLISASDERVATIRRLREEAAYHKRQTSFHRQALREKMAAIEAAEHNTQTTGEGDSIHGPTYTTTRSDD